MRKLLVIGIGAGDPSWLTLQAIDALAACDVFLVPDKGEEKTDLKNLRLNMIGCHGRKGHRVLSIDVPERDRAPADYRATVGDWHTRIADAYASALNATEESETVGLLVWGDPSLYDSTLRIIETLREAGHKFDLAVIPGVTAIQALCARHRIPLNTIGEGVLVTTGRKLGAHMPATASVVVVMLDGEQAFAKMEEDVDIVWGAYLGTPDEILVAGRLSDVKDDILSIRAEARARKGWIMDIYLLRKRARTRRQ